MPEGSYERALGYTAAVKLYGSDNRELLTVTSLERDADQLLIRGKVFGTMPITARLDAEQARAALRMLRPRLLWFLLTLPLRRRRALGDPAG